MCLSGLSFWLRGSDVEESRARMIPPPSSGFEQPKQFFRDVYYSAVKRQVCRSSYKKEALSSADGTAYRDPSQLNWSLGPFFRMALTKVTIRTTVTRVVSLEEKQPAVNNKRRTICRKQR